MNPLLAPMPMSAAEVADLVERVRVAQALAAKNSYVPRGSYRDRRVECAVKLVESGWHRRVAAAVAGCNHNSLKGALLRLKRSA